MAASLSARPPRQFFQFLINRKLASASYGARHASSKPVPKDKSASIPEKKAEIVIPKKKKRDSLTVLRALASTVSTDANAPRYKYVDDPFLIPTSNLAKKSYALSKESGRKAARYMLENYAQWFNENPAEPSIDAFMPPKIAYTHTDATEAALLERIEKRRVKDAIDVYKKMKQDQLEVSQDACRQFLELLCVFNSQDPPMTLMQEEFFYHKDLGNNSRRPSRTWKDDDMAERVYQELEEKTSQDRQHLIRGMAKYLQTDKAFALYDELVEEGMAVDVLTFNHLIRVATFHHDTYDTKWKQVESLLMDMQKTGVEPNLSTFNATLFSLGRIPMYRAAPSLVMRTLQEMRGLGVEPSLASWKYILTVFYPNENAESDILYKIMDHLEGKTLQLTDTDDVEFFVNAMKHCCQNLQDPQLALRIDALLRSADHSLLGDSRLENMYYSFFLRLICTFETLDTIMEVYQRVTPHLWSPNYAVLEELMKAVELQDGYTYLPLLWTDLMLFHFLHNTTLLETLLRLMAKKQQEAELQGQYCHVVRQLLERWNDEREEGRQPSLSTGAMIGHLLTIAERGGEHSLAWQVFELYSAHPHLFTGTPDSDAMTALLSGCLTEGEGEGAVKVVTLMNSLEMAGVSEAAQKILGHDPSSLNLTSAQRDKLAAL